MTPAGSDHPSDQTLRAYGVDELRGELAGSVHSHLGVCDDCRRRVAELSADTLLDRLCDAQARPQSPAPAIPSLANLSKLSGAPASLAHPVGSIPKDLADHPDYEILGELGRGGMGEVYLAQNKLMGRKEVLKVISRDLMDRRGVLDRFLREIRNAAQLHHPNIVTAYSAIRVGQSIVFAMEYVEGRDLATYAREKGPLPVAHACNFIYQAALGLQYAHEKGLVHRDIKPSNLILARVGRRAVVKVLDFGLAKVTREGPAEKGLTHDGQMLGTPDYIAPEQSLDAHKADIRADIYSLGCTLYYLLTGGPPFEGTSLYQVLQAHHSIDAKPLNLVRRDVPWELAALAAKMMAKEPEQRFQTPAEAAQALKPFFKPGSAAAGATALAPKGAPSRATEPVPVSDVLRQDAASVSTDSSAPAVDNRMRERGMRRHVWVVAGAIVGLASLIAIGAMLAHRPRNGDNRGTVDPGNVGVAGAKTDKVKGGDELRRLEGHTGQVLSVAWSADESLVLSVGADQTLRLWDGTTGQERRQFSVTSPSSLILGVALIADGRRALSRSFDETVNLWDLESGSVLQLLSGSHERVVSLAWSPDGRVALFGDDQSNLRLWDLEKLRPLQSFPVPVRRVLAFDGRRAILACPDRALLLWDAETGVELCRCTGYPETVICGALEPGGRRALSGSKEGTLRLWDLKSGQAAQAFEGHRAPVTTVAIATSTRRVLSGSADKTVRLWDIQTGRELKQLQHDGAVSSVALSADGRRAISASVDRTIRIWQLPE